MYWNKASLVLHAGSFKGSIKPMAECNDESSVGDVQGAMQQNEEDGVVTMEEGRCKPCTCREGSRAASATAAPTGMHDANQMLSQLSALSDGCVRLGKPVHDGTLVSRR